MHSHFGKCGSHFGKWVHTLEVGSHYGGRFIFWKVWNTFCGSQVQILPLHSSFCSLEETRTWEASEKEEERKLVADFYLDKLGDLLDRVKDI